jgi:serine/threonine protein kinase
MSLSQSVKCICMEAKTFCFEQDTVGGLPQTVRNVYLELSALAPLAHPHIVSFKGMLLRFPRAGDSPNDFELGIVFELCNGGNLHSRMFGRCGHLLTYDDRLRIVREIAEAMAYVHGLSIVHRDLRSYGAHKRAACGGEIDPHKEKDDHPRDHAPSAFHCPRAHRCN